MLDTFGARYSRVQGVGERQGNRISFLFEYPDGPFTDAFTWHPDTAEWTFDLKFVAGGSERAFATKRMRRAEREAICHRRSCSIAWGSAGDAAKARAEKTAQGRYGRVSSKGSIILARRAGMSDETTQIAGVLDYIGHQVLAQLQGLSDEELNRPLTLPETNTLIALATHLVGAGEFWVLAVAGGQTILRDRLAEFRATGSFSDLAARYERWLAGVHEVLGALVPERMEQRIDVNRYRSVPLASVQEVSVREALLHAVEHSALHLGHIQLTRQLLGHATPEAE